MKEIILHRDLSTQDLFVEAIKELRNRGFVLSVRGKAARDG